MTHLAAIALGSNIGDREANLHAAIRAIEPLGTILAVSSFYDTAPVGYLDQPRFLNAALLLQTTLEPHPLMAALLAIERTLGRDRAAVPTRGPRTLDLDLLLVDNLILDTPASQDAPALTLPHPSLHLRRFVLEPLAEIAPNLPHPTLHRAIQQLLDRLPPE